MQDWKSCQALCKRTGAGNIMDKLISSQPSDIHPEIVTRCQEIFNEINSQEIEKVGETSNGALTFYIWVCRGDWSALGHFVDKSEYLTKYTSK